MRKPAISAAASVRIIASLSGPEAIPLPAQMVIQSAWPAPSAVWDGTPCPCLRAAGKLGLIHKTAEKSIEWLLATIESIYPIIGTQLSDARCHEAIGYALARIYSAPQTDVSRAASDTTERPSPRERASSVPHQPEMLPIGQCCLRACPRLQNELAH